MHAELSTVLKKLAADLVGGGSHPFQQTSLGSKGSSRAHSQDSRGQVFERGMLLNEGQELLVSNLVPCANAPCKQATFEIS